MENRVIAAIDMKAFYSFVECVERGLDPFSTPLVVCDSERGPATIVLSVSPYLKSLGVPSRCRKRDLPKLNNLIFATPRMSKYLEKSAEVMSIMLDYVGQDDMHVYSIDEVFLNIGPYLKLNKCCARDLVRNILKKIKNKTGLVCVSGISYNIFLSKCAMDIEAKKSKDFIAEWNENNFKEKLWPLPIGEMWGISTGYEQKLGSLGIKIVEDLAKYSKENLISYFGIIGEELWEHANGIDDSDIRKVFVPKETCLSLGQMLMRDYKKDEIPLLIKEMIDDLSLRLRCERKKTQMVGLSIQYSLENGGGFAKQLSLNKPTDDNSVLFDTLMVSFNKGVEAKPIRGIGISFSKLCNPDSEQLDIFTDQNKTDERRKLRGTLDSIQFRFGKNSILRSSALLAESTAIIRHNQIGGHKK